MPRKSTAKSASAKSTSRSTARKKVARGDTYTCEFCGLAVTVDQVCGCIDVCDIVCCGEPMKAR